MTSPLKTCDWQGFGAYKFTREYGDINDYSPIFDPTTFAIEGDQYKPGPPNLERSIAGVACPLPMPACISYAALTGGRIVQLYILVRQKNACTKSVRC